MVTSPEASIENPGALKDPLTVKFWGAIVLPEISTEKPELVSNVPYPRVLPLTVKLPLKSRPP